MESMQLLKILLVKETCLVSKYYNISVYFICYMIKVVFVVKKVKVITENNFKSA